ncbi:hypothetical protein [Leifsonia poae]|uniref:hypothetical protein n=1 Tax=Leifsonia poae TaxID=110933 RepID=UPI003D677805
MGVEIVFPDHNKHPAPDILGHSVFGGGADYPQRSLSNLGIYGIVAAVTTDHPKHTEWWGTDEGVAIEKKFAGANDGN